MQIHLQPQEFVTGLTMDFYLLVALVQRKIMLNCHYSIYIVT